MNEKDKRLIEWVRDGAIETGKIIAANEVLAEIVRQSNKVHLTPLEALMAVADFVERFKHEAYLKDKALDKEYEKRKAMDEVNR